MSGGRRGGAVEDDGGVCSAPHEGVLLHVLQGHLAIPLRAVAPPLQHRDQEQDEPAEGNSSARHVVSGRIRVQHVIQPTWNTVSSLIIISQNTFTDNDIKTKMILSGPSKVEMKNVKVSSRHKFCNQHYNTI